MKKVLFLLLTLILFSCQIYTDTSNPALNLNGRWKIKGITGYYDHSITLPPCFTYNIGDIWEFDYNNLIIRNDKGLVVGEYFIGYVIYQYYPSDSFTLKDKRTEEYMGDIWNFIQSGIGSAPANDLIINPPIFPNLGVVFIRI